MSSRSDVGFACKVELVKQVDTLFPWVRDEADDAFDTDEGTLFHFVETKWNDLDDNIRGLYLWLKTQQTEDYLIVEACHDYPTSDTGDAGGWLENPWNVRRAIYVSIDFNDVNHKEG